MQHWKFHRQLVVQGWRASHVLIFHYIFIVNQYSRVTWVSVSTVVVDVQLFVIVTIVTSWSTPSRKPSYFCEEDRSIDTILQSSRQVKEVQTHSLRLRYYWRNAKLDVAKAKADSGSEALFTCNVCVCVNINSNIVFMMKEMQMQRIGSDPTFASLLAQCKTSRNH